jgi:Tfp pilus assembly protein PilE
MTKIVRYILAGIIAVVAIGVIVLCLLVGSAIYGYRAAIRAGNEAATLQNLKTIAAVEAQYYQTHSRTFGTLHQLVSEQMLSRKFDGDPATADGYVWTLIALPGNTSLGSSYVVRADPLNREQGRNHFYLNSESNQIRVNAEQPAGPNDPIW